MGNQLSSVISSEPGNEASSSSSSSSSSAQAQPEGPETVMDDEAIRAVMNAEGPIVQMVLLKADGTVEEVTVDCTPRDRNIEKLMDSDSMTIVGGYQDLSLTVVNGANPALSASSAKLPFPLHAHALRGTTVIMRNGEDGAQQDFTAAEFQALVDRPVSAEEQKLFESENAAIAMKQAQNMVAAANEAQEEEDDEDSDASGDEYTAADAEDDEASSEDSDEDDEEEDEEEEMDEEMAQKSTVLYQVMENLAVQLERAPTMDEIKQALRDIAEAQANGNLGEDEGEAEEEDEGEEVTGGEEGDEVEEKAESESSENTKSSSIVSETPAKDFSVEATAAAAAAALTSPDTVAFASPSVLGKRKEDVVEISKDAMNPASEIQQSNPKTARPEAVA